MSDPKFFMLLTAGPVGSVPAPAGSGAAMGCWAITRALREEGHRVGICHLPSVNYIPTVEESEELSKRVTALQSLGVPIVFVPVPFSKRKKWQLFFDALRGALWPRLVDFYPWVLAKPQVQKVIKEWKPNAIYHMATYTLPVTEGEKRPPRLVMTGDLDDWLYYYQWRLTPIYALPRYLYKMFKWLSARRLNRALMPMMVASEAVITVAHHTIPILKQHGVKHRYLPNPWATNAVEPLCLLNQPAPKKHRKPRIIMVGHLAGTATLYGLYFLAEKILPQLEKKLGKGQFEIRIVGRDRLPRELARKLARPEIHFCGYVEDLYREYVETDVMLVPTPVVTGARTRIAEAFSLGCCVVAHVSESLGMPEMAHEYNALLGDTAEAIVDGIVRAHQDPALRRRLGENARRTYEKYYAPEKAIASIVMELQQIAGHPNCL